ISDSTEKIHCIYFLIFFHFSIAHLSPSLCSAILKEKTQRGLSYAIHDFHWNLCDPAVAFPDLPPCRKTPAHTAAVLLPADRHGLKSVGSRTRNTGFCHPLCASYLFRHKLASFPEKCHP